MSSKQRWALMKFRRILPTFSRSLAILAPPPIRCCKHLANCLGSPCEVRSRSSSPISRLPDCQSMRRVAGAKIQNRSPASSSSWK